VFYIYSYIFCQVRRLAWCNDPESYAGGKVATGRATLARQVKGEHPKRDTLVLQVGSWVDGPAPHRPITRGRGDTHAKKKRARGRPKKNWVEVIRKAMNERNLNAGQWEDRKQWSLGVGQRRTMF